MCILYEYGEIRLVIIGIFVDDLLVPQIATDKAEEEIAHKFEHTNQRELDYYLGMELVLVDEHSDTNTVCWLTNKYLVSILTQTWS